MAELLSAASLLLAIVGVIYGLWYPEITTVLDKNYPQFKEDRQPHAKKVNGVLIGRALPLSIFSSMLLFVFLPDSICITYYSGVNYFQNGINALKDYSAVNTAFCFVVIFAAAIAFHAIYLTFRLWRLKKSLNG